MDRTMRRSVIVFSLLVIGLFVSVRGTISAKATKAEVTGVHDLSEPVPIDPGVEFVDEAGKTHYQKRVVEGPALFTIGDETIEGKTWVEVNNIYDETGSGPAHGWFIHFIGDEPTDETIIWEGRYEGKNINLIFSGKFQAQGRGLYAGMKVKGTSQEIAPTPGNPDPNVYILEGRILDPHGE